MPTLEDVAPHLHGAKFFSTLDASSGFWQIKLSEASSHICTMSTPYGRYRFLRMLFGISTAPEVFQRAMHGVLEGLKNVAVVMDDILVWGTTIQEHDANLKNLLERCERRDLKLNLKKGHFLQDQVRYLGHILTTEGLSLDPERVEDILAVPEPRDLSDARLHNNLQATENDAAFIQLRKYASASWPAEKRDVPEELRTYWNYRDEMHVEDGLVFRSNKVVIPKANKTEILKLLHAAHGGEAKMKMRAREVMYWPTMSCDIEALAKSCGVCMKHKPRNARLPLLSHELPNLPWQLVGLDLFYHNNRTFLIIVDFYSFFFEIKELRQSTASLVVSACAEVFATHGIPAKLYSDNGPPFNSYNFKDFVTPSWNGATAQGITCSSHQYRG
ncbi:uncharacterized protein K02A2.6 [Ixodes scapularis]|uniref:uncharacterized protein K02A2.6 n=1 Tax=Ixodes scapularis TaxID=6945 RepID=UPI001AD6B5D5|nr:uncharacterized protein K02A2.6 [Ixodes scapularis]